MGKSFISILVCVVTLCTLSPAQSRHKTATKTSANRNARAAAAAAAAEKQLADVQAGRTQIAAQIKPLTQFLFLLGGIAKGIESVDQANRGQDASVRAAAQNEQNRARLKASVKAVHEGLDKLETSFRNSQSLTRFYPLVSGVGRLGETAEIQASGNHFDDAGRELLKAVNQLTDALVAMR